MLEQNKIQFRKLNNKEFFGMHTLIVEQTNHITDEEVRPFVEMYRESVKKYGNLIQSEFQNPMKKEVSRLDKERNDLFSSCRMLVYGLQNFPDESVRESTKTLLEFFKNNENPRRLNQAKSSGVIGLLIGRMKEIDMDVLTKCNLDKMLLQLENTEHEFVRCISERSKIETSRIRKDYLGDRLECLENYKLLMDLCVVKGNNFHDESCIKFVKTVNKFIEEVKTKMKVRQKRKNQVNMSGEPIDENIGIENKEVKDVI